MLTFNLKEALYSLSASMNLSVEEFGLAIEEFTFFCLS